MNTRRLVALVLSCAAGLLVCAPAAHAQAAAGTVTKTSGTVTATLNWKASAKGQYGVSAPTLTISRGGVVTSTLDVSDVCKPDGCLLVPDDKANPKDDYSILHVADLDGDGEPEVMFDTFSGGAHCCIVQRIYAYRPATNSYRRVLSQYWGNGSYFVKDLGTDGIPELSGSDDSFAYAFASYASSARPPLVLSYSFDQATGKATLTNVTRKYPAVIRSDAAALLKEIRKSNPDTLYEVDGLLAAYVADQYLLGKGAVGRAEIARARKRKLTAPGFEKDLLKFLKQTGYR